MVSLNSRIGIIGAGTSGVYLAILLIKQGFQVTLFEKAPNPRTDGCGILIVQAGMEALHRGNHQVTQKIINSGDMETMTLLAENHRVRSTQAFKDGVFDGISFIEEMRQP